MEIEKNLLNLILKKPKSDDVLFLSTKLEKISNFIINKDIEKLRGIWELKWSSSNATFLNPFPFVDNLQILDPKNGNALNLLKPRGVKAIIGTGIVAKINPIDNKRVGVTFTHAGLIGPKIGFKKIKAIAEIKKEQKGWLDITYLSNNIRVCRGDKGTLFILKKREDEKLFRKFEDFICKF